MQAKIYWILGVLLRVSYATEGEAKDILTKAHLNLINRPGVDSKLEWEELRHYNY